MTQKKTSEKSSDFASNNRKGLNLGQRVKLARTKMGLSQADLASKIGVSITTIQNYESGQFPKGELAVHLATHLKCSLDWLLAGKGEFEGLAEDTARKWASAPDEVDARRCPLAQEGKDCDLVMVPKVRARLSAGTGSLETSAEVESRYAFRSDWLRSKGQANHMVLMDVAGDSMEPDIRDRDMVLIDQSQADVIPGAIFAIGLDDEVLIKYVDKEPGLYILRSANTAYRSIPIDLKDESLNVRIIGRVIWWCREV